RPGICRRRCSKRARRTREWQEARYRVRDRYQEGDSCTYGVETRCLATDWYSKRSTLKALSSIGLSRLARIGFTQDIATHGVGPLAASLGRGRQSIVDRCSGGSQYPGGSTDHGTPRSQNAA